MVEQRRSSCLKLFALCKHLNRSTRSCLLSLLLSGPLATSSGGVGTLTDKPVNHRLVPAALSSQISIFSLGFSFSAHHLLVWLSQRSVRSACSPLLRLFLHTFSVHLHLLYRLTWRSLLARCKHYWPKVCRSRSSSVFIFGSLIVLSISQAASLQDPTKGHKAARFPFVQMSCSSLLFMLALVLGCCPADLRRRVQPCETSLWCGHLSVRCRYHLRL